MLFFPKITRIKKIRQRIKEHPSWVVFFIGLILLVASLETGYGRSVWDKLAWPGFTVLVLGLALLLLLFGNHWLQPVYNSSQWAVDNWKISILLVTLTLLLLNIIDYVNTNYNKVAVSSVEVWSEDEEVGLGKEAVALQYRVSYNNIINKQFSLTTLGNFEGFQNARVRGQNVKLEGTDLILAEQRIKCSDILTPHPFPSLDTLGPPSGISGEALETQGSISDIEAPGNVSVGFLGETIDLPLRQLLPYIGYREIKIKVILTSQSSEVDNIRIVVEEDAVEGAGNKIWSVEGPNQDWPQLIKYLAYRIRFADDGVDNTMTEAQLALSLGNIAFEERDYAGAMGFYRLADSLQPDNAAIQIMLALTQYHLEDFAKASELLHTYISENETSISPTNFYLACVYAADGENLDKAQEIVDVFNNSLPETTATVEIAFEDEESPQTRMAELDKKSVVGPGRSLSINPDLSNLSYISNGLVYAADLTTTDDSTLSISDPTPLPPIKQTYSEIDAPRQIFTTKDGVYYLTREGRVYFSDKSSLKHTLVVSEVISIPISGVLAGEDSDSESIDLLYTGGVRQIFAKDDNLLLLVDRFGRVLRLQDRELQAVGESLNARQIFPDGNTLYILREDGIVGRTDMNGDLATFEQLVAAPNNQEIAAFSGVVYMLRANGKIWRYQENQDAERNLLIDGDTETKSIFAALQGLFILKNSGDVWLIRNPQNPTQDDFIKQELKSAHRVALAVAGSTLFALEEEDGGNLRPETYNVSLPSQEDSEEVEVQANETAVAATTTASAQAIEATQTIVAQPTVTAEAIAIATAAFEATATANIQATQMAITATASFQVAETAVAKTAEALAIAQVNDTATAIAQANANATATAEAIATAQANATATANDIVQSCEQTLEEKATIKAEWEKYIGELGCPISEENAVWQAFSKANVFWRASDQFVIAQNNDKKSWSIVDKNNEQEKLPDPGSDCPSEVESVPITGIDMRRLWCSEVFQSMIGTPIAAEQTVAFEEFERGLIFIIESKEPDEAFIFINGEEGYIKRP